MKYIIICILAILSTLGTVNAQTNLTQLGHLAYTEDLADIWGYVDSLGNEYALVGTYSGLSIVDVTNPANPVEVLFVNAAQSIWRDMSVWNKHVYATTEGGGGVLIVDLSPLPAVPTNWTFYTGGPSYTFSSAHNGIVDENGFLYVFGTDYGNGGALIFDLNADPMNPSEAGIWDDYYIHDGNVIGDTLWASCIYQGVLAAVDVSNKTNTQLLQTWPTSSNFTHNNWYNNNRTRIWTTDEVSLGNVDSYDISNLSNVTRLDTYASQHSQGVIPHNTHYINDFLVTSYYRDGVTIVDCSHANNLIETGWYDTSPTYAGDGYNGCWGAYPWLPSGNILASDIEEGLYILGPTYVKACYLEGVVSDQNTSAPVNAATVEIITTTATDQTDPGGNYATGTGTAGTYDVAYSAAGYFPDTAYGVVLTNGIVTTQNMQLVPMSTFSMTGQVIEAGSGNPIAGADVLLKSSNFTFNLTTDANGDFNVAAFYEDTYDIVAGHWGHVTDCQNTHISATTGPITITLATGIYDDFTFDNNWTVSSTASAGIWERGEPVGTSYNSVQVNAEFDVTNDCTDQAYVTGNGGGNAGDDDVDGGKTTLSSPVIDLSAYSDPYLYYSRWFFAGGGFGPPNDTLNIKVSNGTTTVILESVLYNDSNTSSWSDQSFRLNDYITSTSTMTFIFEAADNGPGHLVEAGLDHFYITKWPDAVQELSHSDGVDIYPNPSASDHVHYRVDADKQLKAVQIKDISGRHIAAFDLNKNEGELPVIKIPSGVYFLDFVSADDTHMVTKWLKL